MKTLFDNITHLALPDYATQEIRFPKWSCRVTITQEPRALSRIMPGISKDDAIHKRDSALANSRECSMRARRCRREASTLHGDAGGLNRFPISGGVCEHWPREVSDYVGNLARLTWQWDSIARAWHAYAGKRVETYPREFSGV